MSRRTSATPLAALLAALVVLLPTAGPVAPAAGSTAAATDPDGPVRVVLDALSPAVATPGATLLVRGRAVNDGAGSVRDVYAQLRLSRSRVQSRAELDRLARGETVRDGQGVGATRTDLPDLAPGASAAFALRVPVDDLDLGETAVHPMGVEVRGRVDDQGGADGRLGLTRTQLAWASDPARVEPTRVAWLWPLADAPRRRADGRFVDDSLATSLAPTGRIGSLLAAGTGRPGLTWVVDPMLLADARAMTGGYEVAAPRGSARPATAGAGAGVARAFLERLRTATSGAPFVALPFGDPDVAALVRDGQGELVAEAREQGSALVREVLGRGPDLEAALPPGGFLDTAGLEAVLGGSASPLVLADTALAPLGVDYTPTGRAELPTTAGPVPVVLTDARLSRLAATPAASGGAVLAQARFVAETAMVTLERPGIPRAVAIAPPRTWDPGPAQPGALLDATAGAPWLGPATLPELLAEPAPDLERGGLAYPPGARRAELPGAHLGGVAGVGERVDVLVTVLGAGTPPAVGLRADYRRQQLRLVSASLRTNPAHRDTLRQLTLRSLDSVLDGVSVLPAEVQLPSLTGDFRVTVANDTAYDVTVRVAFTTDQPRINVSGSDPVRVAAGSKDAVTVTARALAGGAADVQAQLTSVDGTALGRPAQIRVRVSDYGGAALLVTVGAAALLFLAATRNVLRRVRGPRGAPADRPDAAQPAAAGPVPMGRRGRHVR